MKSNLNYDAENEGGSKCNNAAICSKLLHKN